MHKVLSALFISPSILVFLLLGQGCTLYTSSDRKKFETDTKAANLSSLVQTKCSSTSIAPQAQASKLVNILNADDSSEDSIFLWEHIVNNKSVFETDNSKGVYCLYE
ncbi:MAG: hypothetical protein ACXVBD_00485 [Pseudobdellovibrio sp.]